MLPLHSFLMYTSQWFIQSQGDAIKLNFSTRQLNPTWVVCKLNLLEPYSLHSKGGSALATYFCHSDRNSQMHVEQKLNFFKVHLTSSTWHEEWILFGNFFCYQIKIEVLTACDMLASSPTLFSKAFPCLLSSGGTVINGIGIGILFGQWQLLSPHVNFLYQISCIWQVLRAWKCNSIDEI